MSLCAARRVLDSFTLSCALLLWAWLCLHAVSSFALAWREERELLAEARLLAGGVCGLPRSFPLGGSLVRCEEARAALHRTPLLEAAKRATGGVLLDVTRGARREVWNALGLLSVLAGLGACVSMAAQRAARAARESAQREAFSAMRREACSVAVPLSRGPWHEPSWTELPGSYNSAWWPGKGATKLLMKRE